LVGVILTPHKLHYFLLSIFNLKFVLFIRKFNFLNKKTICAEVDVQ
jgi:hypothetical protein